MLQDKNQALIVEETVLSACKDNSRTHAANARNCQRPAPHQVLSLPVWLVPALWGQVLSSPAWWAQAWWVLALLGQEWISPA